jgi:hypothetical protein
MQGEHMTNQKRVVMAAVAALFAGSLAVQAQNPTNFAGTWVRQADPNAAPAGGGRGRGMGMMASGAFGEQVVVTQDAKTLKAENVQPDGTKMSFTYALDGSESRNQVAMGRQGMPPVDMISKATWSAGKLSIATVIHLDVGGQSFSIEMTDVLSIEGDVLTVQSTRSNPMGSDPTVTTSKYQKAK